MRKPRRRSPAIAVPILGLGLVVAFVLGAGVAHAETVDWISTDAADEQADGASHNSDISADGNVVVFDSDATDLVASDGNGDPDVFVRDRLSSETELVSVNTSGVAADGTSRNPSISHDGMYVAFESTAADLVAGDSSVFTDIFVRDLVADSTTLVSVNSDGTQGNGDSTRPSVAFDGERVYVAYQSVASNLVTGPNPVDNDQNGALPDIFVSYFHKNDPSNITTELVSRRPNGSQGTNTGCADPSISADGKYVAYESFQWLDWPYTDGDHLWDIYVTDWDKDGTAGDRELSMDTMMVSVQTGGTQVTDADCLNPAISADGKYVVYDSSSRELTGDSDGYADVFRTDWNHADPANMVTVKVSPDKDGGEGDGNSEYPSINADGRYVAFESDAPDLVQGDDNGCRDVFVRDLQTGTTHLVSSDFYGLPADDDSGAYGDTAGPQITACLGDAVPEVSFCSEATNLIPGVYDFAADRGDVFVASLETAPDNLGVIFTEYWVVILVIPARYEQDDDKLLYKGVWDEEGHDHHSKGTIFSTMDPEATITITFKGAKLDWIATMGPGLGRVWVSIDGGEPVLVDLSSDTELFQQVVWSTGTLDYGVHMVEIWFPGDLEADEIKPISIDALDIYGGYLMKTEEP